jgi:hypothetical protein
VSTLTPASARSRCSWSSRGQAAWLGSRQALELVEPRSGGRQRGSVGAHEDHLVTSCRTRGLDAKREHRGGEIRDHGQPRSATQMPAELAGPSGHVEDPVLGAHGDVRTDPIEDVEVGEVRAGLLEGGRLAGELADRDLV